MNSTCSWFHNRPCETHGFDHLHLSHQGHSAGNLAEPDLGQRGAGHPRGGPAEPGLPSREMLKGWAVWLVDGAKPPQACGLGFGGSFFLIFGSLFLCFFVFGVWVSVLCVCLFVVCLFVCFGVWFRVFFFFFWFLVLAWAPDATAARSL